MDGLAIGRIVHYIDHRQPDRCMAALVLTVWNRDNGCVNLRVFPPSMALAPAGEPFQATSVLFNEKKLPGTWHWPEKE